MFDDEYKKYKCVWGTKPNEIVKRFFSYAENGKALDIGMGEGKDAIFLAKQGFEVKGIDISEEGVAKALRLAARNSVKINAQVVSTEDFIFEKDAYTLAISINTLHFLDDAKDIIQKIKNGLKLNGIAIITVFIKNNKDKSGCFGKNELFADFNDFKVLHYLEYKMRDKGHGGVGPHFHNIAELVAMKTTNRKVYK